MGEGVGVMGAVESLRRFTERGEAFPASSFPSLACKYHINTLRITPSPLRLRELKYQCGVVLSALLSPSLRSLCNP